MENTEKTTLVLGGSPNPMRYAHQAIHRLVARGIPTYAVGRTEGEVAGVTIHTDRPRIDDLHTISVYVHPDNQHLFVDYMLELRPKRIIFNPGAENPRIYDRLLDAKISVEVACTLVLLGTQQY